MTFRSWASGQLAESTRNGHRMGGRCTPWLRSDSCDHGESRYDGTQGAYVCGEGQENLTSTPVINVKDGGSQWHDTENDMMPKT